MAVCKRNAAYLKRTRTPWSIPLALIILGAGFSAISDAPSALAQSGNGAALANMRGQIQRYGCNLPQYASSVAGCRELHARVNQLKSGAGTSPRPRQPYSTTSRYSSSAYTSRRTPRPRPPQTSFGGGFFGALFGGGGAPRSRSAARYGSYGMPYQGLGGWSNTYPSYMRSSGRYRTLCVRSCDGYYWPVSFSTTRSGIARDANQCQSSCQVPAKLFYHRNPGADVQHMVDLQGKPYSSMENAYRYREEYVPNCRCKPEPWSDAAREVYEKRAELSDYQGNTGTLAKVTNANNTANVTSQGAAYSLNSARVTAEPRPRPRRPARPRYRANDPEHTDRWWAGSW